MGTLAQSLDRWSPDRNINAIKVVLSLINRVQDDKAVKSIRSRLDDARKLAISCITKIHNDGHPQVEKDPDWTALVEDLLLAKNRFFPLADVDSAGDFRGSKKYVFTQPDWSTVVAGSQPCRVDEEKTQKSQARPNNYPPEQTTNPGSHRNLSANGERLSYTNTTSLQKDDAGQRSVLTRHGKSNSQGRTECVTSNGSEKIGSKRCAFQDGATSRIGSCGTKNENTINPTISCAHLTNFLKYVQPREGKSGQSSAVHMEEEGEALKGRDADEELNTARVLNVYSPNLSGVLKEEDDLGEDVGGEMLAESGGNPSKNFSKSKRPGVRSLGIIVDGKLRAHCGRAAEAAVEEGAPGTGSASGSTDRPSASGGKAPWTMSSRTSRVPMDPGLRTGKVWVRDAVKDPEKATVAQMFVAAAPRCIAAPQNRSAARQDPQPRRLDASVAATSAIPPDPMELQLASMMHKMRREREQGEAAVRAMMHRQCEEMARQNRLWREECDRQVADLRSKLTAQATRVAGVEMLVAELVSEMSTVTKRMRAELAPDFANLTANLSNLTKMLMCTINENTAPQSAFGLRVHQ